MKFDKIPESTFQNIQLGAGILMETFELTTATVMTSKIIGATSGGVSFEATPSFVDFGEDIDNCPLNMKELKKLESWEVVMSGTFVTVTPAVAARMVGIADVSGDKITPRNDVSAEDFKDIWWVGDYSDKNGATKGGFVAIRMINALSTGGFKMQSTSKAKGTFEFEFTGHYSMEDQTKVPFEVYVHAGEEEGADMLEKSSKKGA